ncbi:exodeoxyribonuclease V subunit alpha [Egicoccus sp. AB-alg2]|uniref:exodeoxyribonuclease V subunit alpha n=1 Tax=Egicoccus sp. AB-alg2 TaxID=3242693 RepID=UPI00359CE185
MAFNRCGVLSPADVHGAVTLARVCGDGRPEVLLAAALAVRAPQHGHVCVELDDVVGTIAAGEETDWDVAALPWPDPAAWRAVLEDSPLVRVRPEGTPSRDQLQPELDRPLVLVDDRLYLDRYWRYERRVAAILRARAGRVDEGVDLARVREVLDRLLLPDEERPDRQRLAVATAARRALTVIAGGPGTGKTHTVARLLALLHELAGIGGAFAPGDGWPQVAVAAPTGKAADRLTASLRQAVADPGLQVSDEVRVRLGELQGSTLHRLLGWTPRSATRFRHDRHHKLPHEVVVVDETSMVDLPLMAKLLEAMRPDARLVLVGDPNQLASVEAGAVLGDIVGPSGTALCMSEDNRAALEATTGEPLGAEVVTRADDGGIDDAVLVLGTGRRFGANSGIARLATAIHAGDADAVVTVLRSGPADLEWVEAPGDARDVAELAVVRNRVVAAGRAVVGAARDGDAGAALAAMDTLRVLCAHRRGLVGVTGWVRLVERWLTGAVDGFDPTGRFYVGRPVLVTRNEPRLHLFNGDVGVVVRAGDGVAVAFHGVDGLRTFAPGRLEDIESVHAMTIHKSQGSQFEHVVIVLPDKTSQVLTRELLYTAVTRAEDGVTLVGTEAAVRCAVARRVSRASGLRSTLWPTA